MAGANSQMSLVGLDFDSIKNNLKTYLKSQDTFKDYNFDGSGLSVLLDVLAYNTQYNAFYLNMVANEMFLDTALQRPSVVSHAKLLDYVPRSAVSPTAYVDIDVSGVTSTSITLPAYTKFVSGPVGQNKVNYYFVTTESTTVNANTVSQTASFKTVQIKQGIPVSFKYTVDSVTNPSYTFELPDSGVDTGTIKVTVQNSSTDTTQTVYTLSANHLLLSGSSEVYFLEETLNGNYAISFGDGILGKKLTDGNIVIITYLITNGTGSTGANNFTLIDTVPGFTNTVVNGNVKAGQGKDKEDIDSIKYQAPKSYSAQNRAVTKEDYITLIQQNNIDLTFDSVNVWGGQDNDPPVYGQVFVALKPSGALSLTETQKLRLIQDVIRPISVISVEPKLVDPDYTFIKIDVNVLYDPVKTNLTSSQLKLLVANNISNFASSTLDNFNSTFSVSDLNYVIKTSEKSIITNEVEIQLQKKIYPNLTTPTTYKLYYGTELEKGMFLSGVSSSPSVQYRDKTVLSNVVQGILIEEVPSSTGGVDSISIQNAGYGYQVAPTVTIQGDGSGAAAVATINTNGTLNSITVTASGNNYTSAIATITPASNDTTGRGASATVNLKGRYGTLRTYYYNNSNVKNVFNANAGTIDYKNGVITLTDFNPIQVDNPLGQLTVSVKPTTSIIESNQNKILTVDPYDPTAITVNVIAKTK